MKTFKTTILLLLVVLLFASQVVSENPAVQFVGFVKHTVVSTAHNCQTLWTNHKKCNEIRSRIKKYHELHNIKTNNKNPPPMGISYEDYQFLQQGKADRGKVFNLMFIAVGAPRFLPYALLFNPEMLPSPLKPTTTQTVVKRITFSALPILVQLEDRMIINPTETNPIAKMMTFWNKQKKQNQLKYMNTIREETFQRLKYNQTTIDASHFVSDAPISKADQRLCQLPPKLVSAVAQALSGGQAGLLSTITPNFLTRGKICSHLQQVAEADDFLRNNKIDLSVVDESLLRKTCADRWIGGNNIDILRTRLETWLETTQSNSTNYNGNLHKLATMGLNGLEAIREDDTPPTISHMVFQPPAIEQAKTKGLWRR